MKTRILALLAVLVSAFWSVSILAAEDRLAESFRLLAQNDNASVSDGIERLAAVNSEGARIILEALLVEHLVVDQAGALFVRQGEGLRPVSPERALPRGSISTVSVNNVSKRAVQEALARKSLTSKDVEVRRAASRKLSEYPDERSVALIRRLVSQEHDPETAAWMDLAIAKIDLRSDDPQRRRAAANAIAASSDVSLESELKALVGDGKGTEKHPQVRSAMQIALRSVQSRIFWINAVANTVYGLSLGSVLVLAALGLAITFGLMRVINMAHGEMLMLGAYSTFFVRERLLHDVPGLAEWYLVFAIPFAFATTFFLGVALERLVIRHLYGRPLETLLATWGLSLILIQSTRVVFGAQNVTVANPQWLSGGWEALPALVIPYSRIAVLCFTAAVVAFVWFILKRTSVGLKVRAVTQNREIASSLGIPAARIDMWTFGLGSGLAGLGGVALSQLGNVGPELGQQHIIDSFMVVVMGGVGSILGTISAGIGLGIANKILEPSMGAVLGKIMLLALLIGFIQWRPQGLFALKGRAAEN